MPRLTISRATARRPPTSGTFLPGRQFVHAMRPIAITCSAIQGLGRLVATVVGKSSGSRRRRGDGDQGCEDDLDDLKVHEVDMGYDDGEEDDILKSISVLMLFIASSDMLSRCRGHELRWPRRGDVIRSCTSTRRGHSLETTGWSCLCLDFSDTIGGTAGSLILSDRKDRQRR